MRRFISVCIQLVERLLGARHPVGVRESGRSGVKEDPGISGDLEAEAGMREREGSVGTEIQQKSKSNGSCCQLSNPHGIEVQHRG